MSVAEVPPTSCISPTAVHIWLAPQDTPLRMLRPALGLLGVDRRAHAVPFQTSPSVLENAWRLVCDCPTAVQESAEAHDTPLRRLRRSESPYRGNGARDRFTSMGRGSANG